MALNAKRPHRTLHGAAFGVMSLIFLGEGGWPASVVLASQSERCFVVLLSQNR